MNLINKLVSKFKKKKKTVSVGVFNEVNRIEWIKNTLEKLPRGSRILDAGAGEQQYKKFCNHLEYVSQDFAEYNPENLKAGLQMEKWDYGKLDIISDIADIPEDDNSFDAIMCTEVFEHIINPKEAIEEFSRLLKKDGYLLITAPFASLTHFAPYHFYTGFNRFFYENILIREGYEIVEINANGNYFEYLAQEINRLPHISQKYSDVKLIKKDLEIINNLKLILQELSQKDKKSSELLCFGYHVLAQKKW